MEEDSNFLQNLRDVTLRQARGKLAQHDSYLSLKHTVTVMLSLSKHDIIVQYLKTLFFAGHS
jgi:hypothetical protein